MRLTTLLYVLSVGLSGVFAVPSPLNDNSVDPSTCPTIRCAATTHPVYHPEIKSCTCEPNPPVCPNTIVCAGGAHTVLNAKTYKTPLYSPKCVCELDNQIPSSCPLLHCINNHHMVYHPSTGKCGCDADCPNLFCIAEQTPTYNAESNSCSCEWIPGLEPNSTTVTGKESCADTICISEQHGVYNSETGNCTCEWIPGLEPNPTAIAITRDETCADTICISEQHGVYNAETEKCTCEWIEGLEPIPLDPCAEIVCIAEMQPVVNTTTGVCGCEWIPGLEPVDE